PFPADFASIYQFHSKTPVGLIAAVSANCRAIIKAIKMRFDLDVMRSLENCRQHSFSNLENVVGRYERRFYIYLGKLRLPVRAQILITKTFGDLKIFLHAGYHEQLFVLLWRLRQRVKLSGGDAARHQKIACAFRRAFGKDWRFHFHISPAVEVIARRLRNPMTQPQIACATWPTEIEIPA